MVCHEGYFQFLPMVHCRRLEAVEAVAGRSEMSVVEGQQVELAVVIGCFEQVERMVRYRQSAEREMSFLSLVLWCRVR